MTLAVPRLIYRQKRYLSGRLTIQQAATRPIATTYRQAFNDIRTYIGNYPQWTPAPPPSSSGATATTSARSGLGITTVGRDGFNVITKTRDGTVTTSGRDGTGIITSGRDGTGMTTKARV